MISLIATFLFPYEHDTNGVYAMLESDVLKIGNDLLTQWGLTQLGWTIGIDYGPSIRRLGCCEFSKRRVGMSAWYVGMNKPEFVLDTIKHEIAHALAYVRFNHAGHGAPWVRMCGEVGCRPRRLKKDVVAPPKKYIAHCGDCAKLFVRDRLPLRGQASWCGCQDRAGKDVFSRNYLTWTMNPAFVDSTVRRATTRIAAENAEVQPEGVATLLTELSLTKDHNTAKKLRAKLRRLGHRGGLH